MSGHRYATPSQTMQHHAEQAEAWLNHDPPDEGTVATAQVHATLAAAWATIAAAVPR